MVSTAPSVIVSGDWEVRSALRTVGLTPEIVRDIGLAAASAKAESVAVDPMGTPGQLSYIYGVRAIRLKLIPLGWRTSRIGNVEATVNDELAVQLIFQNVVRACTPTDPEAISGKGAASRDLVNLGQGELFADATERRSQHGKFPTVWLVCVSATDTSFSVEVSCPKAFDGKQYEGFSRRLFVVSDEMEPKPQSRRVDADDALDVDVVISKKG